MTYVKSSKKNYKTENQLKKILYYLQIMNKP